MMVRDGPQNTPLTSIESGMSDLPLVTRNEKPIKSSPLMTKRQSDGVKKVTRKPAQKRAKKPVTVSGYHWRENGAGWDLRKDVYVTSNGVRKRKQPYVAHMSQEAFRDLKRQHKGASLERKIAEWIRSHDK